MDKQQIKERRRKRFSELISRKRESLDMTQIEFCDWVKEQTGLASLTYGALQSWEDPRRGDLPSCENFYAIAKIFGTTMDELFVFLSEIEAPASTPEDPILLEERLRAKVKSMPAEFQRRLLLEIQSDLLSKN